MPGGALNTISASLLFISFIENAFKHGVSYQKILFIRVCMQVRSATPVSMFKQQLEEGLTEALWHGLENIQKTVTPLYGEDYAV